MPTIKAKSPKQKLDELKRTKNKSKLKGSLASRVAKLVVPTMDAETALLIQRLNDRITKLEREKSAAIDTAVVLGVARSNTRFTLGHISYEARNHGQRWDYHADHSLTSKYECGEKDLVSLGKAFGRTPFAIFAHLVKLGQINETDCYELWAGVTDKARGR